MPEITEIVCKRPLFPICARFSAVSNNFLMYMRTFGRDADVSVASNDQRSLRVELSSGDRR